MKKSTNNIEFTYQVFDKDTEVYNGIVSINVPVKALKEVAETMRQHGGFPVPMNELSLSDKVWEEALYQYEDTLPQDEELSETLFVQVQEQMPEELVRAAEEYVTDKDLTFDYEAEHEGKTEKGSLLMNISNDIYNKMKAIALTIHEGKTDFEALKEEAPEMYALITDWLEEDAFKRYSEHGEPVTCRLESFPYEVYEHVND